MVSGHLGKKLILGGEKVIGAAPIAYGALSAWQVRCTRTKRDVDYQSKTPAFEIRSLSISPPQLVPWLVVLEGEVAWLPRTRR